MARRTSLHMLPVLDQTEATQDTPLVPTTDSLSPSHRLQQLVSPNSEQEARHPFCMSYLTLVCGKLRCLINASHSSHMNISGGPSALPASTP